MQINKEELKIIDLFRKDILAELTLKQIMKKLNKKSYNWTYNAVANLSKSILISEKKGNTTIVKIDLDSPAAITHLAYLDRVEAYKIKVPIINEIIESCSKFSPFFTLIVAGSYAAGNARTGSDIDLVIISENKKDIKAYVNEVTRLSEIDVDLHVFTNKEFYQMLIADEENFGKEIFRKHLLFYGIESYYQIIKGAVKNGLQSKI